MLLCQLIFPQLDLVPLDRPQSSGYPEIVFLKIDYVLSNAIGNAVWE